MTSAESDVTSLRRVPLHEIEEARSRLQGHVVRTPLVRLNESVDGREIYLKLENLQDTGSFKQRGATNALLCLSKERLAEGVYCPSAGNFAQGLAFMASKLGINSTIIVPDNAPQTKLQAIRRYGGEIVPVTFATWWKAMTSQHFDGVSGTFVHPVCNRHVIAGNGTIGLEILEDLPDVDVIIAPFGGGGMVTGVASAVKATKPSVRVMACEVATAAPLTASRLAGKPTSLTSHQTSFVDGMGGKGVFPEMWNLLEELVDDVLVLSPSQIADTVRLLLERNKILAEGAGAAPVTAALGEKCGGGKIVAVISGGNIDLNKVSLILDGQVPN